MKLFFTFFIVFVILNTQAQKSNTEIRNALQPAVQLNTDNVKLTSSNLPIVYITAAQGELNEGVVVEGHMGIVNNEGERNYANDRRNDYNRKISITYTGKDHLLFDKKSFLIETQRDNGENFDASILGMPKENDWILYAPYSDKTLLRNALVHEMARRAGYYSSRVAFCELVFNGKYHGIYILLETIKRDENRLNLQSINDDDTVANALTGGYIFKIDELPTGFNWGEHGWRALNEFRDAMDITYQYVYPQANKIEQAQKQYIKNYVEEFETVLGSDYFADPDSGYNKYIDVGSFVDYMLINEVTKAATAYNEGVYFYKTNIKKGGKIFAGPFADYTYGFNNASYWPVGNSTGGFAYADQWRVIYWWYRLMQDKYFYDMVYTRWTELRQDLLSDENLFYFIDSVSDHIEEARIRNFEQWPILGKQVYPNSYVAKDYAEEIAELKKWIAARMGWMDFEFFGSLLQPEAEISNYTYGTGEAKRAAINVKLSDEFFNKQVLYSEYFRIEGLPNIVTIDTVLFNSAAQATIVLSENASIQTVQNSLTLTILPDVLNGFKTLKTNSIILDSKQSRSNLELKVYTKGKSLLIKCTNPEKLPEQVNIYNIMGNHVNTIKIEKVSINNVYTDLAKGVYFVSFIIDNQAHIEKVVIK